MNKKLYGLLFTSIPMGLLMYGRTLKSLEQTQNLLAVLLVVLVVAAFLFPEKNKKNKLFIILLVTGFATFMTYHSF